MKNKVSVWEKTADIVIKRASVANITHYEYCFDNNLKNKSTRKLGRDERETKNSDSKAWLILKKQTVIK